MLVFVNGHLGLWVNAIPTEQNDEGTQIAADDEIFHYVQNDKKRGATASLASYNYSLTNEGCQMLFLVPSFGV